MPLNRGYSYLRARMIMAQLSQHKLTAKVPNIPIIYLPGILGSKLFDRTQQRFIWGDYRGVFTHSDYEYSETTENDIPNVLATEQLHQFTIIPKLLTTLVTQELKDVLEVGLGYREGQDLFFLAHDWRADHRQLVVQLDQEIARLTALFGEQQPFIIIAQSASNLAVRYWLRHTSDENRQRIAKWYAFGPPWEGTYHAWSMMETGYYAGSRHFNGFSPDDIAGYPSAYQLLPCDAKALDSHGGEIENFDLYNADCWQQWRIGPYKMGNVTAQNQRVRDNLPRYLANAKTFREAIAGECLKEQVVPQTWYLSDNNLAVTQAIFARDRWYLQAKPIAKHFPHIAPKVLAKGDDHLPLAGLLKQRCGPLVRDKYLQPWGESFVFISQASTHRALINHTPNLRSLAFDIATIRKQRNR